MRTRDALGESWMPAPISPSRVAASHTATRKPRCAIASAAVSPPIPAPATTTVRLAANAYLSGSGGRRCRQRTFRRPCRVGIERRVVAIECRAIGADDLGGVAHVEEDVRMVERGRLADAHELPGADLDHRHARGVVEMGYVALRHGPVRCCTRADQGMPPKTLNAAPQARGTITSRHPDSYGKATAILVAARLFGLERRQQNLGLDR